MQIFGHSQGIDMRMAFNVLDINQPLGTSSQKYLIKVHSLENSISFRIVKSRQVLVNLIVDIEKATAR